MSTPTTGLPNSWNRDRFLNAIHFAMEMGAPNSLASGGDHNRVTFVIPVTAKAGDPTLTTDSTGAVYDIHAPIVTAAVNNEVTLQRVAIEWAPRQSGSRIEGVGQFDRSRATLWVLGTPPTGQTSSEFDQIVGATHALIGGVTYELQFTGIVNALFDVDLHGIYAEAVDERVDWQR